jgi:hypothetical protein
VLPHVLVAPLAVAEADHRLHLGEERVQCAEREQCIEAALRILAHHDAVELVAHPESVELRERCVVLVRCP